MDRRFALLYTPGRNWLPGKPVTKQLLQEHIAYMTQLNAGGKLYMGSSLNAGTLDTTQPAGLIVIDAQSLEDALEVMHNDPAIRAGIVEGACYPWYFLLGKGGGPVNNLPPIQYCSENS